MKHKSHNEARNLAAKRDGHKRTIRELEGRMLRFLTECGCQQCVNMTEGINMVKGNP